MSKIVEKDFINDLYLFYRYFIASNYKDSVPAPHIHKLANKLMELALNDDGKHRLAVSMPPRHSKSSMVTLAFPLWLLFQDPNVNIMIVTGSPKLAEKFGIQLREYVRNLGHYFNVYLSNVKQASTHIMFCDKDNKLYKGNIMLASSGGGITGQDADYLILDDPYTGNDEEFTPSALQKKIDWINRVVEQRIEPHTKYCVLHTRWHSEDIIGYYRENEKDSFEFIEFPAITEDNEPLWKERYTMEDLLKKKKTVGERVFSSVYQQQPIDTTSDFFNMHHLKYGYPEDYEMKSTARAWDIASSDALSNNDFTAGVRMVRSGDNCIITDLVHGRFGNKTKDVIQTTAFKDTPTVHVVIETGVAGAGKLLFSEWKNQLKGYFVERAEVSGGKSKVDRATPFKNAIEDGKVYIAIEDETLRDILYDELSSFPVGKHDDITDACSHCYNYLFVDVNKPKPRAKVGVVFL